MTDGIDSKSARKLLPSAPTISTPRFMLYQSKSAVSTEMAKEAPIPTLRFGVCMARWTSQSKERDSAGTRMLMQTKARHIGRVFLTFCVIAANTPENTSRNRSSAAAAADIARSPYRAVVTMKIGARPTALRIAAFQFQLRAVIHRMRITGQLPQSERRFREMDTRPAMRRHLPAVRDTCRKRNQKQRPRTVQAQMPVQRAPLIVAFPDLS